MKKYNITYDIVLLEKPGIIGLTKQETINIFDMLDALTAFPMEIGDINGNSSAMGFITPKAAEKLQFEYDQNSEIGQFISSILDDMELESEDCTYQFGEIRIWMSREVA